MKSLPISNEHMLDSDGATSSRRLPVPATPDVIAAGAQLACLLEVSAEKPGNVTPTHDFADTRYEDFLRGAVAIGPAMASAGDRPVGETILAAIRATRRWTPANVNLGIVLLLAPLAKAALTGSSDLRAGVGTVLRDLTVDDARQAYTAIRLASPGGLEAAVEHDVRAEPTVTLREAMAGAVERDSIAAEYLSDYAITFGRGLPALTSALGQSSDTEPAVIQTYLELLAAVPDTLIARKRGEATARAVSERAAEVVDAGGVFTEHGRLAIAALDAELREDDNALNPGTTADLVAATLFVALLGGILR